jgi:hypothetical protein
MLTHIKLIRMDLSDKPTLTLLILKILSLSISDFSCGFGLMSLFVGYSEGRTTISYNTFNHTVTITFRNYEQ